MLVLGACSEVDPAELLPGEWALEALQVEPDLNAFPEEQQSLAESLARQQEAELNAAKGAFVFAFQPKADDGTTGQYRSNYDRMLRGEKDAVTGPYKLLDDGRTLQLDSTVFEIVDISENALVLRYATDAVEHTYRLKRASK